MASIEIKNSLIPGRQKDIYSPPFAIAQRRFSNQRIADVKLVFLKKKPDALSPINVYFKRLNISNIIRLKNHHTERSYPEDVNNTNPIEFREKYNKLHDKHLELISEINRLKNENEKLKLLAYKSYDDLKEESAYEISRVTMEKDSLLILMELRENKKLNYLELQDRITCPGDLFPRLSELFNINFIILNEKSSDFSITPKGIEFLVKRGL